MAAVYISLGLLGVKIAANGTFENGTAILSSASTLFFGKAGTSFIGVIFTLACFTTVVGLTSACGQYFSKLLPKASYKFVITAVTLIGFTLSNIGLNQILKVSVPFLVTAYPLTIVLITLSFFNGIFTNPRKVYGSAILFTGVFAALGGLSTFGFDLGALQTLWEISPFASVGMEWVVPAAAGTALGILLSKTDRERPDSAKRMDVKASL